MKCSRCQQEHPDSEFVNKNGKPVRCCSRCQKHSKRVYADDPQRSIERSLKSQRNRHEQIKAYKREQIRKYPERYLHHMARIRAKKKRVPFELTVENVTIPTHCPILGIPLSINSGKSGPNSPTLDRIIPQLGYVPGNVIVMSHRANTIKSDASVEEIRKVLDFLEGHTKNS